MSQTWATVLLLCITTLLIRASGPVLFGGRPLPSALRTVVPLLAPALLAALVVSETLSDAEGLVLDERLAGVLAAGGVLTLRRDALLPAIAVAAAVTACARAAF